MSDETRAAERLRIYCARSETISVLAGAAVDPVVDNIRDVLAENERLTEERDRLRAMQDASRRLDIDVPQTTKELLVRLAFEMECISHGRAAELLECSVQDVRERGWLQSRIRDALAGSCDSVGGNDSLADDIRGIIRDYDDA